MRNQDGGPAFPRPVSEDRNGGDQPDGNLTLPAQCGMSLRDWFAGQALAGVLAGKGACASETVSYQEFAYNLADLMLAQREKLT